MSQAISCPHRYSDEELETALRTGFQDISSSESLKAASLRAPAPLLQPGQYHLFRVGGPGAEDLGQDLLGRLQLLAPGVYGGGPWCPPRASVYAIRTIS